MPNTRIRRRKALSSLSERRRQCRKRTHMRVMHRSKQYMELDQLASSEASPDCRNNF